MPTMHTSASDIDLKVVTPLPRGKCPFGEFGCEFKGDKEHLKEHIRDSPAQHLPLLCDGVRDLYTLYREVKLNSEIEDRRLDFVDFRYRELDSIFSSQLIWRLDNVRALIREARDDIKPSIFSPPFYSGKQGYKLAASIALNGDGDAKGEFISVYMTILQGEYDSLLPWPFGHMVTFTLMDQKTMTTKRRHVQKSLKPNTCNENRSFLGRPIGERNPRFGIKKFVAIKEIFDSDYLRDDAIFLKVNIDQELVTPI